MGRTTFTVQLALFALAALFYVRTWRFIRQLVTDVNSSASSQRFSAWRWDKAWPQHARLFPESPVRREILISVACTMGFMIAAVGLQMYRSMLHIF